MEPDFERFLKKISENNNMLMDAIKWNAEAFRKEAEKTIETNYVSRSGTHNRVVVVYEFVIEMAPIFIYFTVFLYPVDRL